MARNTRRVVGLPLKITSETAYTYDGDTTAEVVVNGSGIYIRAKGTRHRWRFQSWEDLFVNACVTDTNPKTE